MHTERPSVHVPMGFIQVPPTVSVLLIGDSKLTIHVNRECVSLATCPWCITPVQLCALEILATLLG